MPLSFTFRPTARSFTFLAVTIIFFFTIVEKKSDILASIFVVAVVAILIGLVFYSLIAARRLSKRIKTHGWFSAEQGVSLSPVVLNVSFDGGYFSSLFSVLAQPTCKQTTTPPYALFELGGIRSDSPLQQTVIFPHRGDWTVDSVAFEFRDIFGLTLVTWKQAVDAQIRIAPHSVEMPDWPVVVSSTRAGESIEHVEHRQGDYLDLKPYHPSDGARRIVWKLFAKTKELVARQPERSVDPEGECYLYALIPTIDDGAAFSTIEYIETLQSQDCDVICSCLGANGDAFLNDATEPLITSAFKAQPTSKAESEIDQFISTVQKESADSSLVKLIISVGESLFSGKAFDFSLTAVGEICATNGIKPHFLLAHSRNAKQGKKFENNITDFFRYCADRTWEVSY